MASFTKAYHRQSYPSISPFLEANSQRGRTVVITGGTEGIGLAIAKAFVAANAANVIILGRREEVLEKAVHYLQCSESQPMANAIGRVCDIGSSEATENLWRWFGEQHIAVDILVLNAASTIRGSLKEDLGAIWGAFELNVHANMRMTQRFIKQNSSEHGKGRALLNISSFAAHSNPMPTQGTYSASKAAFASLLQHLAEEVPSERTQIINIHPGAVLTSAAKRAGYDESTLPWDSEDVPGHFCVWAATEAARFLHGRFVWANWDSDELQQRKDEFEEPGFLKIGVQGVEYVDITNIFQKIVANEKRQKQSGV